MADIFQLDMLLEMVETIQGLPESIRDMPDGAIDDLLGTIEALDLPLTLKAINRIVEATDEIPFKELHTLSHEVRSRLADEADQILLVSVEPGMEGFYDPLDPLFGTKVEQKFPDATKDIDHAGKCLAIGLHTACVFHLMRAAEFALKEIAQLVRVKWTNPLSLGFQQWGVIIDQVAKQIQHLESKHPSSDEKRSAMAAYSDILIDLRAYKSAWRNQVSHNHITYTEDEARRIYEHVKDLMQRICNLPKFPDFES